MNQAETQDTQVDPKLDAIKKLAQKPVSLAHPLSNADKTTIVPLRPEAFSGNSKLGQQIEKQQKQPGNNTTNPKTPRKSSARPSHYRKRWPKSLDVRHNKQGHQHLRDLWTPLQESRLDIHGRAGCEEMSHMDLGRAMIDHCLKKIKLPSGATPKTNAELQELIDKAMQS